MCYCSVHIMPSANYDNLASSFLFWTVLGIQLRNVCFAGRHSCHLAFSQPLLHFLPLFVLFLSSQFSLSNVCRRGAVIMHIFVLFLILESNLADFVCLVRNWMLVYCIWLLSYKSKNHLFQFSLEFLS